MGRYGSKRGTFGSLIVVLPLHLFSKKISVLFAHRAKTTPHVQKTLFTWFCPHISLIFNLLLSSQNILGLIDLFLTFLATS